MSTGSQVANVGKTLLVCATATFLGYLGFVLLERHLKQVESAQMQAEAAKVQQFRSETESLQTDVAALLVQVAEVANGHSALTGNLGEIREQFATMESRYSALKSQLEAVSNAAPSTQPAPGPAQLVEPPVLFGLSTNTAIEYGSSIIVISKGQRASKWFKFKTRFTKPPVVLVSHSGKGGGYTSVVAERIGKDRFAISMRIFPDEEMKRGPLGLAWLAIGEVKK
jgi:hypothetical protein